MRYATIVGMVLFVVGCKPAPESGGETSSADQSIWEQPERACSLMEESQLGTDGYSDVGGQYSCTASKVVSEVSEATGYKENVLEYGVWGSSGQRADSITLDVEMMAPEEAESAHLQLSAHTFGLFERAFERELPDEVMTLIRDGRTGSWQDDSLYVAVKKYPYGNTESYEYKVVAQPQ